MVTAANDQPLAQRLGGTVAERPHDQPPRAVPVALRTAQHVHVSAGRFGPPWSKRIVLAKWVIEGEAAIGVRGFRHTFRPGDVAIYVPTIPHAFWAVAPRNEMCWFSIDGPLAEPFAMHLELRAGVYPYGPAPVDQILEMADSLKDLTLQGRRRSSLLAMTLLHEIANRARTVEVPEAVRQVQHIIEQEFADTDLSTESLASRFAYHRGSLSRLFHRHTGVTIIDYITQVRLQEARALLLHSGDKISEVARKCGFREASYFCRWVRKHTNVSPKDLRNSPQV